MIKTQVMYNQSCPVVMKQFVMDMPRYVVIDLHKILHESSLASSVLSAVRNSNTDRHKETRCTIGPVKHPRKEFEPSIVSIHKKSTTFCLELSQPCVLVCKARRRIRLCNVEDHVQKRRNGPRCHGLQPGHCHGRRTCMGRKRKRSTGPNQAEQIHMSI